MPLSLPSGRSVGTVPISAMAYPNRDTKLVVNVHARWEDASGDTPCIDWARAFIARSSTKGPRRNSRPRNMFSAIVRSGASMIS